MYLLAGIIFWSFCECLYATGLLRKGFSIPVVDAYGCIDIVHLFAVVAHEKVFLL
ncbi:hypothetical protein HMPREF0080_01279 [Anaeroglobus geminatus F0357]|uniref:Uncharacterized protein n=1 Tax=Anaeroglobus geminatus F0357 TaxID=861450 RepID=G9YHZ5_9FIRM|nr:hypothetical protein HMPREF0080_01279 [Anaeroglobus geminatus F0357]